MDEVVERHRLVEFFTNSGAGFSGPLPEGLVLLKRDGQRCRGLLDQQSGALEWLRQQGVKEPSLTRLTLEDLFVSLFQQEEVS